jgi:hypothetical protein
MTPSRESFWRRVATESCLRVRHAVEAHAPGFAFCIPLHEGEGARELLPSSTASTTRRFLHDCNLTAEVGGMFLLPKSQAGVP